MLILEGSVGSDSILLLKKIHENNPECTITNYTHWLANATQNPHLSGIVFIRVMPEIAYNRLKNRSTPQESTHTLDYIQDMNNKLEQFFINKIGIAPALKNVPVLVLNGNIDFQTDFSQFYNHLFYIKKFLKEIQERHDLANGTYREQKQHRKCC
jgi:Deoxynucleoside kinase